MTGDPISSHRIRSLIMAKKMGEAVNIMRTKRYKHCILFAKGFTAVAIKSRITVIIIRGTENLIADITETVIGIRNKMNVIIVLFFTETMRPPL